MRIGGSGGANTNASGKPFEECFRPNGMRVLGGKSFTYFTQDDFVEHRKKSKTHNGTIRRNLMEHS